MMQTSELRSPTLDVRPAPRRQDEQPRRAAAFEAELAATPERDAPQPRAQDPRALEPRSRDAGRPERDAPARDDAPAAQRRDESRSAANEDARGSQSAASAGRRDRIEREASGEAAGEARAAAETVPGEDEAAPGEGAEAQVQDPTVDPAAMLAPPPPEPPAPPPPPPGQAVSAAVQAAIAAGQQQQQQQQQQDQAAPQAPPQGAAVAAAAVQAAGAAKAARSNGASGAAVPQAPADGEAEATEGEGEGGEATTASEAASQATAEGPVPDAPKPPRAVPAPQGAQMAAVDPAAQAAQSPTGAPGQTPDAAEAPVPEAKDRKVGLDAPAPGASPSELQALRADLAGPATETVKVSVTPLPQLQPGAFGGIGQDMAAAQQANGPAQAAQTPPTPMAMLPIEIGMRAMEGQQRFEIRLSPETLGRIDVRLDIGEDGGVKAHIVVDRADTLGLLQRDARTLERAFEQAGLKTGDGALQFSLGGQSQGGQNADGQEPGRRPAGDLQDRAEASARDIAAAIRSLGVSAGGLDIRI